MFALTFVIMIVSFIPWEDLGFDGFVAGQSYEEVTTTMTGEEVATFIDDANDGATTTTIAEPVEAVSVSEEEVTPAWSSSLPAFLWASGTSTRPPRGSCSWRSSSASSAACPRAAS